MSIRSPIFPGDPLMILQPMNEAEYADWSKRATLDYATAKRKANDLTEKEAHDLAVRSFAELLPHGVRTPGHHLYTMKEGGENVGTVWLGFKSPGRAFVFDIIVEENHRGHGYGRSAMRQLETEARRLGATRIGLHVFGYNKMAIQLYISLGYETTDLVMEKSLSA